MRAARVLACALTLSACGGAAGGGGADGAAAVPDAAAPDLATPRDAPREHFVIVPSDARRDAIPMLEDAALAGPCGLPGAKCPIYGGTTVWSFHSYYALSASMGPDGSMYIGGSLERVIDLDPTPRVDLVGSDDRASAFMMKLGPTGAYGSTLVVGGDTFGNPGMGAASVTADASFVVGWFDGSIDLDPGPGVDIHESPFLRGGSFVSKFNAAGKYLWGRVVTGSDEGLMNWGRPVATSDGGAFVTGSYTGFFTPGTGDLDPGPATLPPPNRTGAFISRLDAAGKLVWVRTFGGDDCDFAGMDAHLDAGGILWVAGPSSGLCAFDRNGPTNPGPNGFVVASLLPDGKLRTFGMVTGGGDLKGLQVARDGSIYLAGVIGQPVPGLTDPIDLDPSPGVSPRAVGDEGLQFVMKLDNDGKLRWVQQVDGVVETFALAADDGVIVAGFSDAGVGMRVLALDADGHETWRFLAGGRGTRPNAVLPGANGFFVLGEQSMPGDLDPSTGVDRYDGPIVFLSKYTF